MLLLSVSGEEAADFKADKSLSFCLFESNITIYPTLNSVCGSFRDRKHSFNGQKM